MKKDFWFTGPWLYFVGERLYKSQKLWNIIFKLRQCMEEGLLSQEDHNSLQAYFTSSDEEAVCLGIELLRTDKFKEIVIRIREQHESNSGGTFSNTGWESC